MKLTSAAAVAILAYCSSAAAYRSEYDDQGLYARDTYADDQDLFARDAAPEPFDDDDFGDLYARDALPEPYEADDFADLYAREAEAEPLEDEIDLYAREAEAEPEAEAEAEFDDELELLQARDEAALKIHPRDAYMAGFQDGLYRRENPGHQATTGDHFRDGGRAMTDGLRTSGAANAGRNVVGQTAEGGANIGHAAAENTKGIRKWFGDAWKKDTHQRNEVPKFRV